MIKNHAKLEESITNFINKNYEARVEHSKSSVCSNSFYVSFENANGEGFTVKISDHNTIWQRMSNYSTIFIQTTMYNTNTEVKNALVEILEEKGAVKTVPTHKKIVQIEKAIEKLEQERDNAFFGSKKYKGVPHAERMEIWHALLEKKDELFSQLDALKVSV